MATLTDVARKSGASIATVSRVINGHADLVASDTRERVLAAVRELRYRPTPNRIRQRAAATQNLAVILGDIEPRAVTREPYFLGLFEGMLDEAAANGYSLTVHVQRMWTEAKQAVRHRFDGHCDGALAIAPLETDELARNLWDRGTPLVTVGADLGLSGVTAIDMDNVAAGAEAVRLLAAHGHRNVAYLGVTDRIVSSRERREGCLRAAAEDPGLTLRAYAVGEDASERGIPLETGRTPDWIADALEAAFAPGRPRPTGLVCWNDLLARQAIASLERRGLRVPDDVSVVGFDASGEGIASFRQPLYEIGRRSVQALLGLIAGEPSPASPLRLPAELVVRESVGRPPAPDLKEEKDMNRPSSIPNRQSGFTLIELLVVIAIIAILAAILFPVFAQAKAAAKKTTSLSNVKNLMTGALIYCGDSDDLFPLAISTVYNANGSWNHDKYWPTLIYPYVKSGNFQDGTYSNFPNSKGEVQTGGIFQSPGESSKQINGSYVVHNKIFGGSNYGGETDNAVSQNQIDDLASKVAIVERGVGTGQAGWFSFASQEWFWGDYLAPNASNEPTKAFGTRLDLTLGDCDNSPNYATANGFDWANCSEYPRYRHNRATVAAMGDGHASTFVRSQTGSKLDWYKNIYIRGLNAPIY